MIYTQLFKQSRQTIGQSIRFDTFLQHNVFSSCQHVVVIQYLALLT